MFRAITRLFKTFFYLLSGRINATTDGIAENSHVVTEEYNEIIRRKTTQVRDIRDAVADLMTIQENKKASLTQLTEEITKLLNLKAGAKAKATKLASGKTPEQAKADPEFVKCMAAFQNFSSTLLEKQTRQAELEKDITEAQNKVNNYKLKLTQIQRDLQKLREESHEAVADLNLAKSEREANEALAGIGKDDTAEQLSNLRGRIQRAKSQAKITSELAGTDSATEEAEFLAMAETSEAETEFMQGIFGAAVKTDSVPEATVSARRDNDKLPE